MMPNAFNPDVPPAWHAIKLDETEHYDKDFRKKYEVEKIYGIYVADLNSRTYCCEITPSYALYFIKSVPGSYHEDHDGLGQELEYQLLEADSHTPEVAYFHCHTIDGLSDDCKHPIEIEEDEWREDPEDSGYEAVREEMQCNPVW